MKPTKMAFEKRYSDDSGVEFAVRFDSEIYSVSGGGEEGIVEFESTSSTAEFPLDKIDWLIACLTKIKGEISDE